MGDPIDPLLLQLLFFQKEIVFCTCLVFFLEGLFVSFTVNFSFY